jgi:predicted RNase H-like HicB family nuclease
MSTKKPVRSTTTPRLHFRIETEREEDGRWIAEINEVPGALSYGRTEKQAKVKAYGLALRVIADQV